MCWLSVMEASKRNSQKAVVVISLKVKQMVDDGSLRDVFRRQALSKPKYVCISKRGRGSDLGEIGTDLSICLSTI